MNPARWQRITQLFHEALERHGADRAGYLREATAGDPALLREVETLLDTHERSGGFLDEPAWGVGAHLILDEEDPAAGGQVGPYRILEEVGRGGMGVVYAAEDQRLGRMVALKALTPEYVADERRRQRLTREARAAAALSHPAIATVFALEEIDGALYIVSELVRGLTLREELRQGPLPPDVLLPTLCDIASALASAHELGIVHRDLKPENVIRRTDGQIKILDFGLALVAAPPRDLTATRLTEAGLALGTPGYMAPEQLGGGVVDSRADIFAFGVLAWELATGEHPFGSDSAALLARLAEMLDAQASPPGARTPHPAYSRPLPVAGLDAVARRCMRARPEERYRNGADLLADLRLVETAQREGTPPTLAASEPRRSLWWWQFHQGAMATLNTTAAIAAWLLRDALGRPYGSWMFYTVLVLATISVTLRLNLLFTSRVHPGMLRQHRARLFPAIAAADTLLAAALATLAAALAGVQDEAGGILIVVSIVILASLALVEPATTRAAGLSNP